MSYFGYPLYPVAPTTQLAESNISGSTTLGAGAATYTKAFFITGAGGYTIALPALDATNYTAATFSIFNNSAALCTINVAASTSDTMLLLGSSYTSISILPGERFVLQNMQTSWVIALESASRTTTAPQFDSTIRTASTSFVQRALGNVQSVVSVTGSVTLTQAQVGSMVEITSGSGITITLPSVTGITGGTFYFYNNTSNSVTVACSGAQTANLGRTNLASFTLQTGGNATLITDGASWEVLGETMLPYSNMFGASQTSNGYQKFPGGFILQWGSVVTNGSGQAAIAFPITFPNNLFRSIINPIGGNYTVGLINSSTLSAINVNIVIASSGAISSGGNVTGFCLFGN